MNSDKKVNLTNLNFNPIYGIASIRGCKILRLELTLYEGKSETNWKVFIMSYTGQLNPFNTDTVLLVSYWSPITVFKKTKYECAVL